MRTSATARHWVRLVVAAALAVPAVTGSVVLGAVSAHAAVVLPPTVRPSAVTYFLGTPFDLALSPNTLGEPAVAYQYQINGGSLQRLDAPGGIATLTVTPTTRQTSVSIQTVAADGTVGAGYFEYFLADTLTPRSDKDIDGDGHPDLLTVGGTPGLPSGIWQGLGTGTKGRVTTPATSVGGPVDPFNPGQPGTFAGAQVVMGHFKTNGLQDVLIYYPSGTYAGNGVIIGGSGDGAALVAGNGNNTVNISSGMLADANGNNPLQVVNVYDAQNRGGVYDDLLTVSGDPTNGYGLSYFPSVFAPGAYGGPLTVSAPSPDGTPWDQWTLAGAKVASGTAVYLWNRTTGALYLWEKLVATDNQDGLTASLSYTQYRVAAKWNKGAALSTLEAADFTGDGIPDLWAVGADGTVRPYVVTDLSTRHLAEIEPGRSQRLH